MTDNDIIVPLKCLVMNESDCRHCKLKDKNDKCQKFLYSDVLGLIDENNRQKAEIEALIAGQETLQKYRDEEINRLEIELKAMRGAANSYKAEVERLKAFKSYFDELYGKGLDIANWHKNGDLEPFDSFYNSSLEEMAGDAE